MTDVYVIDANVLSKLSTSQRRSAFVREHCRVPSEVLHEVEAFPDIDELRALEIPVSLHLLTCLADVMRTVAPDDFKLVDLYGNKGNADPLLVASALAGSQRAADTLFPEEWKIVSDDVAVRAKATEHGVNWLGTPSFVLLLAGGSP